MMNIGIRYRLSFGVYLLIGWFAMMVWSCSQQQPEPSQPTGLTTDMIQQRLGVTPDQATKIHAIIKDSQQAIRREAQAKPGDREAILQIAQAKLDHADSAITSLLNEEQKMIYLQYTLQYRERVMQQIKNHQ